MALFVVHTASGHEWLIEADDAGSAREAYEADGEAEPASYVALATASQAAYLIGMGQAGAVEADVEAHIADNGAWVGAEFVCDGDVVATYTVGVGVEIEREFSSLDLDLGEPDEGEAEWLDDETEGYVAVCGGVDGDEPIDCTVRVGRIVGGYLVDEGDDVTRNDVGRYATVVEARAARDAYIAENDEGNGQCAERYLAAIEAEALARATAHGRYAVVFAGRVGRRYDDEADAEREVAAWYRDTQAANPGTTLLWRLMECPEVRDLGDN